MRIDAVYIAAFAGAKEVSFRFDAPFTCIYGKNEMGKTTVLNFIRMMLYGSNAALRNACRPLSGEGMAGYLELTDGDAHYRLERVFGKSRRSDRVTLTDLTTGKQTALAAEPGEVFLSINEDTFVRTCFVGNVGSIAGAKGSEEIAARLQNLVASGSEHISAGEVQKRLETAQKLIQNKTGTKGRLLDALAKQREDEAALRLALQNEELRKQKQERVLTLEQQILEVEKRLQELEASKRAEAQTPLQQKKIRLSQLENLLAPNGERIPREVIGQLCQTLAEQAPSDLPQQQDLEQRLTLLFADQAELQQQIVKQQGKIEQAREDYHRALFEDRRQLPLVGTVVFAVLCLLALIFGVVSAKAWLYLLAAASFPAAVGLFWLHCAKKNRRLILQRKLSDQEQQLSDLNVREAELKVWILSAEQEQKQRQEQHTNAADALAKQKEQSVCARLAAYGIPYTDPNRLLSYHEERARLLAEIEVLEHPRPGERQLRAKDWLQQAKLEAATLRGNLHQRQEGVSAAQLEERIRLRTQTIASLRQKYRALQLALEGLEESFAQMQQQFGGMLNRRTAMYLESLTRGKYRRVTVDKELHLQAMGQTGMPTADSLLSAGTADQAFLALRLAIAGLIVSESKRPLPLFLDDSLMQYDDERCADAVALLKSLSEQDGFSQVVMFTCHRSIRDLTK